MPHDDPAGPTNTASVAGVDGARGGWLAILWDGGSLAAWLLPEAREIITVPAARVAVDMPIGLAESGPRECDRAARALLPRGRRSSVFAPPRRYMLGLSYADANAVGKTREGVGLSKQAWNIAGRIAALDACLTPAEQARVVEAHPELIFHALNAWAPLPRKRSDAGHVARSALLRTAGLPPHDALMDRFPRRAVKPDDVLDALACALVAWRCATGTARRVPARDPLPADRRGLHMAIWY